MALVGSVALDLAACGHSKSFGGCTVSFDFRHF
jgi:hypothetical protein